MSTEQAQQVIALLTSLETTCESLLAVLSVCAVCLAMLWGSALWFGFLKVKDSSRVW